MKEFWPFALDLTEFSELAYDGEVAIAVHQGVTFTDLMIN